MLLDNVFLAWGDGELQELKSVLHLQIKLVTVNY